MMKHLSRISALSVSLLFMAGCGWFDKKPEIAKKFEEHYQNKLYADFDTLKYRDEFMRQYELAKARFRNPKTILNFYEQNKFEPVLVDRFQISGQLKTLARYVQDADTHGFDAALFRGNKIDSLSTLIDSNRFATVDEVYPVMAKLELYSADAIVNYTNVMQFGAINPKNLFFRYYMPVKRPDSTWMAGALNTPDLKKLLDDVQPKSPEYPALQKNYIRLIGSGRHDSLTRDSIRTVLVNMERFRWKIPERGKRFIAVNIPDFRLTYINADTVVAQMKVCVGERREEGFDEKFKNYLKTKNIDDRPMNHETAILASEITTLQLNPVWNIPRSIAQSEIYWSARKNPFYLTDNGIRVYRGGQKVENPDTINWRAIPRDKIPYKFKQSPGEINALGKFKFIFNNENSIYLHDTPNKLAFSKKNRAVSHGCVRVEDPLKLVDVLVNDSNRLDRVRLDVGLKPMLVKNQEKYADWIAARDTAEAELRSRWMKLEQPVPLFIDYYTCWPDSKGGLVWRPDVYKMDEILAKALKKYWVK
ncbi:MAG: L,D-transpeptidase family protein [Mucilaginibacter polytrichastri]|nr:L,D-transpeptidase family protein [Mucilaginibacter polytrichastri]